MKLKNLRLPFAQQAIGSQKDNDQYLYQSGFENSTVADGEIVIDNKKYLVQIVCVGEQRVFVNWKINKAGDTTNILLPIGEDGERERVLRNSHLLARAQKLEKANGTEYLDWQDNCWLDIELYEGDNLINSYGDLFGSVYGSIKECLNALCEEDVRQIILSKEDVA